MKAPVAGRLAAHMELMVFMIEHGIDPIAPEGFLTFATVDEPILSHQPFEARYPFTADDDTLTLSVDDDLSVVDVPKGQAVRSS